MCFCALTRALTRVCECVQEWVSFACALVCVDKVRVRARRRESERYRDRLMRMRYLLLRARLRLRYFVIVGPSTIYKPTHEFKLQSSTFLRTTLDRIN